MNLLPVYARALVTYTLQELLVSVTIVRNTRAAVFSGGRSGRKNTSGSQTKLPCCTRRRA